MLITIALPMLLVAVADARPDGAPSAACVDISPMHGEHTRTFGPPEYGPFLNNFPGLIYIPGQTYTSKCAMCSDRRLTCSNCSQ